jgi:predicted Zn-dependent protease
MGEEKKTFVADVPEEERWLLQRADGFLDLGMTQKAREELDRVAQAHRGSAAFRAVSMRVAFEEKDWHRAADIASSLREQFPCEPAFWIQLAYAKRRSDGIEVARHILTDALARFPKVATIPFNLACYECQLGRLDEAMRRLNQAVALDAQCREAALEDEDLRALWPKLGG